MTTETVVLLVVNIALIIEAFGGFGSIEDRAADAFGNSLGDVLGVRIVLIMCGFVLFAVAALVLQLAGFHVMLGIQDGKKIALFKTKLYSLQQSHDL